VIVAKESCRFHRSATGDGCGMVSEEPERTTCATAQALVNLSV
jgi:hypothetical protein